jgi:hypothetical protein
MKRFLVCMLCVCASNSPPVWTGAPASLQLVQGETKSIPLAFTDPDGDPVTATITASALETAPSSTALVVHAAVDAPGSDVVHVVLDDGRGQTTTYAVPATIDPLAWQSDVKWAGASGPIGREHGVFLIDDLARTVMLIGGSGYMPQGTALSDVWKLDIPSGTWTTVTPTGDTLPPLASARAVRMPGTTTAYLFGGYTGDGTVDTGDLYRVDYGGGALKVTKLTQVSPPPPRELHGFGFDPKTATFVVFGGFSYANGASLGDTWTMQLAGDTATWTKLAGAGPSARYGFFFGTDEVAGRFVVFSGAQDPNGNDSINAAQDTWALDMRQTPPAWSQVLDGTEPNHAPGRRNGCFVVDPRGPSLYIFGGTSDGQNTQPGLFALDMRPSHEGFSPVVRPNEPVLRSSDFGYYDSVAGSVSCAFGNSLSGIYTDVATLGPSSM